MKPEFNFSQSLLLKRLGVSHLNLSHASVLSKHCEMAESQMRFAIHIMLSFVLQHLTTQSCNLNLDSSIGITQTWWAKRKWCKFYEIFFFFFLNSMGIDLNRLLLKKKRKKKDIWAFVMLLEGIKTEKKKKKKWGTLKINKLHKPEISL